VTKLSHVSPIGRQGKQGRGGSTRGRAARAFRAAQRAPRARVRRAQPQRAASVRRQMFFSREMCFLKAGGGEDASQLLVVHIGTRGGSAARLGRGGPASEPGCAAAGWATPAPCTRRPRGSRRRGGASGRMPHRASRPRHTGRPGGGSSQRVESACKVARSLFARSWGWVRSENEVVGE